jgi:hypothetical protein
MNGTCYEKLNASCKYVMLAHFKTLFTSENFCATRHKENQRLHNVVLPLPHSLQCFSGRRGSKHLFSRTIFLQRFFLLQRFFFLSHFFRKRRNIKKLLNWSAPLGVPRTTKKIRFLPPAAFFTACFLPRLARYRKKQLSLSPLNPP